MIGPDSFQIETDDEGKLHRRDPTKEDTTAYTYIQQAAVPSDENAHSGDDVSDINSNEFLFTIF